LAKLLIPFRADISEMDWRVVPTAQHERGNVSWVAQ
jgi:hypothetical protein